MSKACAAASMHHGRAPRRLFALRALASLSAAVVIALTCAYGAWAAEAYPATTQLSSGAAAQANGADASLKTINVVDFTGVAGERVFVTVTAAGEPVVEMLPHVLGDDADAAATSGASTDVFTIELVDGELESALASGIQVTVYADRAGAEPLYEGAVYPVYASLVRTADADASDPSDASADQPRLLIGTRTGQAAFEAPDTLLHDGVAYKIAGATTLTGEGALQAAYEEYSPATTADGSIRYVDVRTSQTLTAFTAIPGLANGETRSVAIPETITDGGTVYRTLSFQSQLEASNPGAMSFVVPVAAFSDEQAQASGHYLAAIAMVDENGNTIASDRVYVRGAVTYTAPDTIYKETGTGSDAQATVYTLAEGQSGVLNLVAGASEGGTSTYEIAYVRQDQADRSIDVTFIYIDGSQRATNEAARVLGRTTATVSESNPTAVPAATYAAGGTTYTVVDKPETYAYSYSSGATPVVNVYCLPEGYQQAQEESYQVTINYVDYATRNVIDSETFTSSPSDLVEITNDQGQPIVAAGVTWFDPPAQFELDGVTWVLLAGQGRIDHHYYSGAVAYTVYYRDRSKPLESAPTISRVRVVYRDGTTTLQGEGAEGEGAAAAALLATDRAYTVADAEDSTRQVTGQDGRDALQERIDDDATPLSSGVGEPGTEGTEGSQGTAGTGLLSGVGAWAAGIGAALAAVIAFIVVLLRRRRADEQSSYATDATHGTVDR